MMLRRRHFRWVMFLALAAVLLVGTACDTRDRLDRQMNQLADQITDIRQQGAAVCAPREYAAAEAHLDFAREEWGERDYIECQDHMAVVQRSIDQARGWLGNCMEKLPPDKDGDGVLDNIDQCPDDPEDIDEFEDEDGCPDPDNDQDGILDPQDNCPVEAEDKDGFEDEDGCPDPDNDQDGLLDADDKCPDEFGPKETGGCPQFIEIKDNEILLKQKIHFDSGRSNIRPESFPILNEIASVLKGNKSWVVRVEGHTDSRGGHSLNMNLSNARANACRDYLMQQGVEGQRLIAVGYGPDQPIASNNTSVGREKNRRTEFKIVSK